MIHENDPANPVGAWGQQSTTGETILMKYSAMFMIQMAGYNPHQQSNIELSGLAKYSILLAKTLITELNKEIEPSKPNNKTND